MRAQLCRHASCRSSAERERRTSRRSDLGLRCARAGRQRSTARRKEPSVAAGFRGFKVTCRLKRQLEPQRRRHHAAWSGAAHLRLGQQRVKHRKREGRRLAAPRLRARAKRQRAENDTIREEQRVLKALRREGKSRGNAELQRGRVVRAVEGTIAS
eukprot:5223804-Pleurochrysis_carterae.AAC.2